MAKHIIFLIHGMGTHNDGWSKPTQKLIKKLYGQYPLLSTRPFDNVFTFQEIRYDNLFQDIRQRWKDDSNAVLQTLADNNMDDTAVAKVAELGAAGNQDNFFTTHILDVIFYRFVPLVTDYVRVNVAKQILTALNSASDLRWSVIAHSLGTAVAHDTIHAIYNTPIPDNPNPPLSTADTRAQVIMMVANVSRLLQTGVKAYESIVRPSRNIRQGACSYFLNARHQLDPFTKPKQFDPADDWPDVETRSEDGYQSITTSAISEPNVHDLDHYLENPKVHIPFFRALRGSYRITDQEAKASIDDYLADTPLGRFNQLRQDLKKLDPGENAEWKDIMSSFTQFLKSIR